MQFLISSPTKLCFVGEDKGGGALPLIPSRKAGGEVVGGSSRKQEGEIKMVFPQSERGNDHRKIFFEHLRMIVLTFKSTLGYNRLHLENFREGIYA